MLRRMLLLLPPIGVIAYVITPVLGERQNAVLIFNLAAVLALLVYGAVLVTFRPAPLLPWLLVGVGFASWVAGDILFSAIGGDATVSVADALYGLGYVGFAAAAVVLIRHRLGERDLDSAIDALLIGIACFLLLWIAVISPAWNDPGASQAARVMSALYPLLDALLLFFLLLLAGYVYVWRKGVFDWSGLDQAVEKALQKKVFLYISVGVGPEAPEWIYAHGVPKVFTGDERHLDKWPYYPYPLAPAYKQYYQRLISELGKRIRGYPQEKQDRIAFIQVKTGCTGDECAYKGSVREKKYDLPSKSPAWREFRLWAFDVFVKTFQGGSDQPQIALMFNNVAPDDDEGNGRGFPQEWKWVTANARGGVGIKLAGSARGHHLSGERTKIETWQPRLIATEGTPLFARSEMDQTWQRAM